MIAIAFYDGRSDKIADGEESAQNRNQYSAKNQILILDHEFHTNHGFQ